VSFDILAPHYAWMEFLLAGEKLQRCRTAFLDQIPAPRNILLVGEGHGRCLAECCRRFPRARVVCIDASEQMLIQARRRLETENAREKAQVEFIRADVLNWSPRAKEFDLIATNFFLDCFAENQLEQIICRLAAAAAPAANWLLADFQIASSGLRRTRSRLILWIMYAFFRAVTRLPASHLAPPDAFLKRAEFVLRHRLESDWGLLHADWWQGTE